MPPKLRIDIEYRYLVNGKIVIDLPDGEDEDSVKLLAHYGGTVPPGTQVAIQWRVGEGEWRTGPTVAL